jgi:hypothetical protein
MAETQKPRWATYKFDFIPHHSVQTEIASKVHIPSYESIVKASAAPPIPAPPTVVDYRSYLLPIRDQGQEGCCVAESMCCIMEYQSRIQIDLHAYMSPQFIFDLRANLKMQAMEPVDAFQIAQDKGCPLNDTYPFGTSHLPSKIPQAVYTQAENFKIKSYASVMTVAGLQSAVATYGPCMLVCPIYDYTSTFWNPKSASAVPIGGHCVTIVGYDASSFIVRNSWGADWANGGYSNFPFTDWGVQFSAWSAVDAPAIRENYPTDTKSPDSSSSGCCVMM